MVQSRVTLNDVLTRIETRIIRLEKTVRDLRPSPSKTRWMTFREFAEAEGKTQKQWRYLREVTNPELFRVKPGSTQYQINYTAFENL